MFNPLIPQSLGLALKAALDEEAIDNPLNLDDTDESSYSEVAAKYSDNLTIDDEMIDEADPETLAMERRLRRAGIKRFDQFSAQEPMVIDVTLSSIVTRKPVKVTVIRQDAGDKIIRIDQEWPETYVAPRRKWAGHKLYRQQPLSTVIISNRRRARERKVDEVEFSNLDERIVADYRKQLCDRLEAVKAGKPTKLLDVLIRTSQQMLGLA